MLANKTLQVKSYNSVIILDLEDYNYGDAIEKIDEKFSKSSMYDGFVVNQIHTETLTKKEIDNIKKYINRQYGIIYKEKLPVQRKVEPKDMTEKEPKIVKIDPVKKEIIKEKALSFDNEEKNATKYQDKIVKSKSEELSENKTLASEDELPTKIYRKTLRSGAEIVYDGNVVLIGDVNPGAKIKAAGDIIVIGNLRGIAHAGTNGNKKSVIIAHALDAVQIAIADIIAIPPDDFSKKRGEYYMAYIDKIDEQIVIEAKK